MIYRTTLKAADISRTRDARRPPPPKSLTGRPFLKGQDCFCEVTLEESREQITFRTFQDLCENVFGGALGNNSRELSGCFLGAPWGLLEAPRELLGVSVGNMHIGWEILEAPWGLLGAPWGLLGAPWELLGAPWEVFGSS